MQKFVYYPKCVVCEYYKYHFNDWFMLLDDLIKNTDIAGDIIIKYGEYKKHLKKHKEVTLIGKV